MANSDTVHNINNVTQNGTLVSGENVTSLTSIALNFGRNESVFPIAVSATI